MASFDGHQALRGIMLVGAVVDVILYAAFMLMAPIPSRSFMPLRSEMVIERVVLHG
jgi:hypothetical protein